MDGILGFIIVNKLPSGFHAFMDRFVTINLSVVFFPDKFIFYIPYST